MDTTSERVIAYIDGFNLYYGMKDSGWRRYYWLNPESLVRKFLRDRQLCAVKYFTAQVTEPPEKKNRQKAYLDAIDTLPLVQTMLGRYELKPWTCYGCNQKTVIPKEKMSDVRLATELLIDAFYDAFDTAFVISGDSDLVPPIQYVRKSFSNKNVAIISPPNRVSSELRAVGTWATVIGRATLAASQFPDEVARASGHALHRPVKWGGAAVAVSQP